MPSSRYRRSSRRSSYRKLRAPARRSRYGKRKSYRKRSARRSYRGRTRRSSRRSSFAPRQRMIKRSRTYTKVRGTGSKNGITITAKELIGVVIPGILQTATFVDPASGIDPQLTTHTVAYMDAHRFGTPGGVFQAQRRFYENQYLLPPGIIANPATTDTILGPAGPSYHSLIPGSDLAAARAMYINSHGATAGQFDEFAVQPGVNYYQISPSSGQFPELIQNAALYDKYQVKAFSMTYEPAVGTATLGTVCMSVCPNPTELPVADRRSQMKETVSASNSVFTRGAVYYKPSTDWKYTQSPITSKNDRVPDRWTDSFNVLVTNDAQKCTTAAFTNASEMPTVLGYLYATYVVSYRDKSSHTAGVASVSFPMERSMASQPSTEESRLVSEIPKVADPSIMTDQQIIDKFLELSTQISTQNVVIQNELVEPAVTPAPPLTQDDAMHP